MFLCVGLVFKNVQNLWIWFRIWDFSQTRETEPIHIFFNNKKKYKSIKYNLDHINEFEILLNLKYLQKKKIQTLKCKIWALIIELKFTR